jgi:hypothetical protein
MTWWSESTGQAVGTMIAPSRAGLQLPAAESVEEPPNVDRRLCTRQVTPPAGRTERCPGVSSEHERCLVFVKTLHG